MNLPEQTRLTLVSIHPTRSPQSVPLASAFLAAHLRATPDLARRLTITVLDLYCDQSAETCAQSILASGPDLIGFSVYAWNRSLCVSTVHLLRQEITVAAIFCGGPEATADQSGLLSAAPWSFLIHGEGEATLAAVIRLLLAGREVTGIPGTARVDAGRLISSPAPEMMNPDQIPSPLLSGEINPEYYSGMLWQISRGCSFHCDFCFDGGGSRTVRRFSLNRLEEELRWFVTKKVSQVVVLDSTFNSDRKRAIAILKLIRKIAPDIHFHFEVRSEFLDREQAELFSSITCSLQIGLQSGDSRVLQNVGRNFSKTDFVAKVNLLNETGAIFGFDLIYGLPGDSLADFRKSLDFALSLLPNHLDIFPLALLPGTALTDNAEKLGLFWRQNPPYTLVASPTFPADELAVAERLAGACDIFYSRGKAVAWFMSLLRPLKIQPAQFLERFCSYMDKAGPDSTSAEELHDQSIFELQRNFISKLFSENNLQKLLPIALDIMLYNYCHAAALQATPPQLPTGKQLARINPLAESLQRSGSAQLATFRYEILEIMDSGHTDLRELVRRLSPTGSTAVIYPKNGEVLTESLFADYFRLIEQLDGRRKAGENAVELGFSTGDAADFLKFALAEGIVVKTTG